MVTAQIPDDSDFIQEVKRFVQMGATVKMTSLLDEFIDNLI